MTKWLRWLKAVNSTAKKRAEIILAAKGLMMDMDPQWRPAAGKNNDDIALLLMRIGLVHVEAVYQGQMAAQNVIRGRKAYLN